MKINNLNNGINQSTRLQQQEGVRALRRTDKLQGVVSGEDRVSISEEARFLQELRDATGGMDNIRHDVVRAAIEDVEAGRVGTAEDYERAIDALLQEL